ncbi:MAG TPA: cytochrome c3 family protein [Anaeromyxobacter sp.]|nr:cytochrome c3 family protein [Anaeromyxobacter sp.]
MLSPIRLVTVALAASLAAASAQAADPRLAPLPKDQAVSSHSPYEMGACDTCHARKDPRDPGPASITNDTCFGCHDEFKGKARVKMDRSVHPATDSKACTACHSPHNARNKKLLLFHT